MEYGFLSRAGKFLQEQTKSRRGTMVFLCLAAGVTLGTLGFLKLYGQAMTHKVKMLDCQYEVHEHTEDCYEENEDGEKVLICGLADYVIHVHNDDCYDQKGNLVCTLEEHELHEHDDSCWEEVEVLICDEEESEGSKETETDAEAEKPADAEEDVREAEEESGSDVEEETGSDAEIVKELACGTEEHKHDDSCYAEGEGCGKEEHVHEDGCYETITTQVCEVSEHTHDDSCYSEAESELSCEIEEHEHDDSCYDDEGELICEEEEHTHNDDCYTTGESELICGEEEHTHDDSCYEVTETLVCEIEEHEHDDSCAGESELICEIEEHEHDDSCYVETEAETEKKAESEPAEEAKSEETVKEEDTQEKKEEAEKEEGHKHTDDCYETQKVLTCGELELHTHDTDPESETCCYTADCFDEEGNLIEGSRPSCGLLQLEEHVHTEECFQTVELTPEEIAAINGGATLHIHTDECYDGEGNLICGHEVTHLHQLECYDEDGNLICGFGGASHVHEESCYDEEGNLVCGYETAVHPHTADCYDEEGNLICGYETAVHPHTADCYDEEGNLICGYATAVHVHDETCFDEEGNLICGYDAEEHEHDIRCYDEEGNLICGYEDAKDHEHDSNCYDEEGNLICGYEGVKNHEHDAGCYDIMGNLICGYEGVEDHVHTEACYDEAGNLICGYEVLEVYDSRKIYESDKYIVVVKYNNDANIPEEAELIAEEITPDSDQEHYGNRETEYREMLKDETASMRALLKIGFYLEGAEIEPETPVAVSIQFIDEDGLAEGKPITVIHFAEGGTEKLDGSDAKDNSTSFKMMSFSEIAIGYGPEGPEEVKKAEDGTLKFHLSDDFEYANDAFHITFHIEGDAVIPENANVDYNETESVSVEDETQAFEAQDDDNKRISDNELNENEIAISDGEVEGEVVAENNGSISEDIQMETSLEESLEDKEKDALAIDTVNKKELEFSVDPLSEKSEEYTAFVTYSENQEGPEELLRRQILSCNLTYRGLELDLSECKITAEISMTRTLEKEMEKSIPNAVAYLSNSDGDTFERAGNEEVVPNLSDENSESRTEDEIYFSDVIAEETSVNDISTVMLDELPLEEDNVSEDAFDSSANYHNDDPELGCETDICFSFYSITRDGKVVEEKKEIVNEETEYNTVQIQMEGTVFISEIESIANVHFNVGYYAEIETVAKKREDVPVGKTIAKELTVIDTSGGKLPKNGANLATVSIFLDPNGNVIKKSDEIEIYSKDENIAYFEQPNLSYFNKLRDNPSYSMIRIEVGTETLVDGETVFTMEESFPVPMKDNAPDLASVHFTNKLETKNAHPEYILLREGTTVRLVYKTTGEEYTNDAVFYDYDISTGAVRTASDGVKVIDTKAAGINHPSNCSADVKYAFGNNNAGTNYGTVIWNGNQLNKYNTENAKNDGNGCTFGLVSGVDGNDVVFNVAAPKVFGSDAQKGKTIYGNNQYGLVFDRVGDTYTLKSVSGTNTANLDKFTNTTGSIWSNNFWPMDDAPSWGTGTHDMKFGSTADAVNNKFEPGGIWNGLPVSDDGKDHNSYFGMYYSLDFNLDNDYVGPLEYLFFGDDDMWVFLDDKQLVCDIGGVHSSVGEYVNLWDYLKNDDGTTKTGTHTLKFFYTERGASGSSCWMQFTLPSVTENKTKQTTGSMRIEKSVVDKKTGNELDIDNEFEFNIKLTDAMDDYSYTKYDENGIELMKDVIVWDGADFTLKNGQYIEVSYLPIGTEFTITEKEGDDSDLYYYTEIKVDGVVQRGPEETDSPKTATGVITAAESTVSVEYKNILYIFELPETGGTGTSLYTVAGVVCLIFGAGFMYRKKFRGRRV